MNSIMLATLFSAIFAQSALGAAVRGQRGNNSHCDSKFCTWWHDSGEINTYTLVQPGNVRQSHQYYVQISVAGANKFYDSFVYKSIPRNGNGRIYSPWDAPNSNTMNHSVDDGITIKPNVKILRRDGISLGPTSGVVIRPSTVRYALRTSHDGGIIIRVPKDSNGRKFSVELSSDLYNYRSNGSHYVSSGGSVVGVESTNALMIFASPFTPPDMILSMNSTNIHTMTPGPINNGDWGSSPIRYFPPGNFYAAGHGVLSGEHYVYQANPTTYYQSVKDDGYSLRMWWHNNLGGGQTWYCVGPTLNAPRFNTMDFHGNTDISVQVSDYKQVGAFFFQTDGPQMYPHGVVHHVFYHVNDDAIKVYYSDVSVSNITVWKGHNDPIIQMGWSVRNVSNVTIDTLNVIHTRYIKSETYVPSSIIGASPFYASGFMTVSNVVCEGLCPALLRITPLQSYKDFVIRDVAFPDGLQRDSIGTGVSIIPASEPGISMDLQIMNWTVVGQKVAMENFQSDSL
ncbi:hypothetical protein H2201_008480, partial [Coniosporium apollinis]